ncbi:right-handed parallel beta-helix repeat-containing protein [bacterium]|nr:right-handed parallel beta-helix repeat-containing protein [bacterium]
MGKRSNCESLSLVLLVVSVFFLPFDGLAQGDLTPPGPPMPIMKTMDQVQPGVPLPPPDFNPAMDFPIVIKEPGYYYLTQNLTGIEGSGGIEITTDTVRIDLRGFSLMGPEGVSSGSGINIVGDDCRIEDGTVTGWSSAGIICESLQKMTVVRGISALGNGGVGIQTGNYSVVTDCLAGQNGSSGISIGTGSRVQDCTVFENDLHGITVPPANPTRNDDTMITNCLSRDNGVNGINLTGFSVVRSCTTHSNGANGIQVEKAGWVIGNLCQGDARSNPTDGAILIGGSGSRVEDNHVHNSHHGIVATAPGNIIMRNTIFDLGGDNYGGIVAGNVVGPIIDSAGMASNTNPGANFRLEEGE